VIGSRPSAGRATLTAWIITLLLALIAALISYQVGRNWLGESLRGLVAQRSGEFQALPETPAPEKPEAPAAEPPREAAVELHPRSPNPAEQHEIESSSGSTAVGPVSPSAPTPDASAETSATAAPGASFLVSAGSFADPQNAQVQKRKLEAKGYQPYVSRQETRTGTFHRVVVGVFGDRAQADKLRGELSAAGFDASVFAR
jgi:cell division septation protein DedD